MKITSLFIADNVRQDPTTKKLYVEGVFSNINAGSFPAVHKQLSALTVFEGKNKKYNYKITIEHDSKILMTNEAVIDKRGEKEHTVITAFENIPLPKPGEYLVRVKLDNQIIQKTIEAKKIK